MLQQRHLRRQFLAMLWHYHPPHLRRHLHQRLVHQLLRHQHNLVLCLNLAVTKMPVYYQHPL